ncbi:sensor histidine kinase [Haloarchaeobius iranensis]|uniref:histidine kinase n=1 Tax=Haloarchaeobius iranensis TaxID=996166 RepID=A0A1H0A1X3_9EURY|nr:PAS domain S-box protein [Haloarchaeobius iranensis]SDN27445.1 PAS domain S-box-containing protein [Haloarchaeobius iranensis]
MASDGGRRLQLLVADGDAAFVDATEDAIGEAYPGVDVETVTTGEGAIRRARNGDALDGVLVGETLERPIGVIEHLDTVTDLPVVYLTDGFDDWRAVADAVEAGADDYFPRTTSSAQYEVVIGVLANDPRTDSAPTDIQGESRASGHLERSSVRDESFDRTSRAVFEHVSDGLIVHDAATGEILDVNQRFCELNGYDRAELVGQDIGLVTPPDEEYSYEAAQEKIEAAREEGPQLFEWRNQRKDGETFPVEVHLSVVHFGDEARVLGSVRDISERKQREREFEQIFNAVQDAIGVFDPETLDLLDANEAYLDMLGYEELESLRDAGVEGLSVAEEGYTLERGREIHQRVADSGEPAVLEWRGETKDGERRWLEVKVAPARIRGESVTIAINRDVTERKERERELRENERRLGLIAEHIDEIIYLASGDYSEILYVNPAYEEIYGRSVEELYEDPRSFVEAAHPADRERYEADVRTLIEDIETGDTEDAYGGEYRIERDGEVRWVTVTRFPIEDELGTVDRIVGRVRDITERKRREREYEQIFNGVNDGVTIHDPDTGEILDANETYLDIFAYDTVETVQELGIEGLSVTEEGYTAERARALVTGVASSGEPRTVEWRIETADGEQRWFESTMAPAEISGETRVLAIQRDITERKRREREYEQIFNGVNDGIAIQDPETAEVLDVNRTYVERLGYGSAEEALEQGYEGLTATGAGYTKATARELCHRVMETGEPETVEWQLETKAGDRLWIEATVSPAVIGGEDRIISIQRDITEQRQLERRLRTIAERIDEVVYLTNGDLSEALYVNSAYADVFGRSVDELYEDPETYFEPVVPEDRDAFESVVAEMRDGIESGEPAERYEFEYRIRRPDGEVRRVETTSYPVLGETSDSHRYVNVTEDVTGRRAREQRLSVLNRVLRHNVRNGLDVVLAHADRIGDDDVRAEIRDQARDLLELSMKAREAEEVMAATTDTPDTIDLTAVAERVVDRFQSSDHSGEITLDCPRELRTPSHRTVIRRVLIELLENALTHSDKDTPQVEISVRRHAKAGVEIAIADDGPGIPEQERQILTNGTETQLEHGRGIGLWFVNWAVTQLGGDLYYRPNTPEGSVVTIRL